MPLNGTYKMRKITHLAISVIVASLVASTAYGKALRSPVQTGDNIIIAKGDIPTPEKYQPAIQEY